MSRHTDPTRTGPPRPQDPRALEQITAALAEMQYGRLTVVVQDGRIIQLERTEKVRLAAERG